MPVFVFDAEAASHVYASAAVTLRAVVERLRDDRILFVVARPLAVVRERLKRLGLADLIRPEDRFATVLATMGVDVAVLAPAGGGR